MDSVVRTQECKEHRQYRTQIQRSSAAVAVWSCLDLANSVIKNWEVYEVWLCSEQKILA